jgi:3-hydroxyisobutyrate dehydrogenase-like beta-hydroxyacid dehydrogenase
MCVTHQAATRQILVQNEEAFSGKLLVQLTTSTPQEARMGEAWAQQHHAWYMQGAITGSPGSIGTADAHLLLAGAKDAFHKAEQLLRLLATNIAYKGEAVGVAPAWDMVMLMH